MKIGLDVYDRNARLKPALLLFLPATLAIIALAPDAVLGWAGALAATVQAGGAFLLAQIIGDIGKKKEGQLFAAAGGRPTERLLSHRYAPNRVVLAQRHKKLRTLMDGVAIPTAIDEERDAVGAWEVYAACAERLRTRTRHDKEKYAGIHRENVHYGFRRNMWGVKVAGITVASAAAIIVGGQLFGMATAHQEINFVVVLILVANILLACAWAFLITPAWVLRAANLYADRLLEAIDTL